MALEEGVAEIRDGLGLLGALSLLSALEQRIETVGLPSESAAYGEEGRKETGGADRDRTDDLLNAIQVV